MKDVVLAFLLLAGCVGMGIGIESSLSHHGDRDFNKWDLNHAYNTGRMHELCARALDPRSGLTKEQRKKYTIMCEGYNDFQTVYERDFRFSRGRQEPKEEKP